MNAKGTIRKIFFISFWAIIGGGMITLLAAAMRKQKNNRCRDYSIIIKGNQDKFFADKKDIQGLLTTATDGKIKGQLLSSFNLQQLEQLLENNTWIDEAELYFDNRDVLHVKVTEREPLARIFTTTGNSYYIDKTTKKIPLSDKKSARVPVFTGFPEKKTLTKNDSLLLNDVKATAEFISSNPFWMAQVAQIDITADRNFEMIPVVGNHLVRLGSGEKIAEKFNRLMVFYKEVLSKTGFDKYKVIDVQYAGQVVGVKGTGNSKVDSVQLRLNVEKLLKQAKQQQENELNETPIEQPEIKTDLVSLPATNPKPTIAETNSKKSTNPNPLKSVLSQPGKKQVQKSKPDSKEKKKEPKAIMTKKPAEEENRGYNE